MAMASSGLESRLSSLSATHKQTTPLIHRLQNFSSTPGAGDDARVELGAEIHLRLKEMEEEMELLRVEIEQLEATSFAAGGRKRGENGGGGGGGGDSDAAERDRMVAVMGTLEEDLRSARAQFRKAQLQAKRNAEIAKRKERQLLFAGAGEGDGSKRKGLEKLTQDDLVVNASDDVTAALRRTHHLMQSELSRSQFAQETLEQSTAALSSLSESYSSLDTLLASSRSLVGSLLRSQKSDTWYLETAFYILIGTIIWLLFRRIFYGPLWWLIWLPVKVMYSGVFSALGLLEGSGLSSLSSSPGGGALQNNHGPGATIQSSLTQTASGVEGLKTDVPVINVDGESENRDGDDEGVLEQIEKIVGDEENKGTNVDDISPEERLRQEEIPRNSKKRMWEEDAHVTQKKDEL
ncbi:hypothetical protein AJ80_02126 [Polytolypa hystricis UAMH7299]|uniref:Sec20 C-terminal domain-containing protein n=1 Tax=Polytolypa hystricis (strain UAMH7299) TaxID=1447883 RepID=A0A2B7YTC0_POLH7|nr:hypothetical protein AJ80_02126 [Polytolypa hystricis UAMH7299]